MEVSGLPTQVMEPACRPAHSPTNEQEKQISKTGNIYQQTKELVGALEEGKIPKPPVKVKTYLDKFPEWKLLTKNGSSLHSLATNFQVRGGNLEGPVDFNLDKGTIRNLVDIGKSVIYPVCESGMNRSQLTYRIAKDQGLEVMPPHGALNSVDMVIMPPDDLQKSLHDDLYSSLDMEYAFYQELPQEKFFGSSKRVSRFGEEENARVNGGLALCVIDLDHNKIRPNEGVFERIASTRQWMDENYYLPLIRNGGVVIAYNKGLHGMLFRLMEVAQKHDLSLEKVRMIPIFSYDPFPGGTKSIENFITCVSTLLGTPGPEKAKPSTPSLAIHQRMWTRLYKIDFSNDTLFTIVAKAFLWLSSLLIIPPVAIWLGWSVYDYCLSS